MVDIAIADDSAVIRNLIEEIVRYEPGYRVAASFDNGRDIVAWVRDGGAADVFVIDMRLPGLSGTATISALRRYMKEARILAFSASAQEESVRSAMAAGADGYLLKESSLAELMAAITVAQKSPDGAGATEEPVQANQPSEAPADADEPDEGAMILVIDDHELVRSAMVAMLQSKGFRVHACETSDEARTWLAGENDCAAALVDLRLGGGESGAAMVEEIRVLAPRSAVILHSGAADADGERVVRETGADGFLAKGDYTIDEMVTALTAAIDSRSTTAG